MPASTPMSTFQPWTDDETKLLGKLVQEVEGFPDWKAIARALGTGRTEGAVKSAWNRSNSAKTEPQSWSIKAPPLLPPVGTDVLIRCEGDELEMGGVTHQVARVLAVLKGGVKVHWHGWSEVYQQDEDAIILASSGRLLGWNTQKHLALAAQHVREITAIDEGPIDEQYQMPDSGQYVVRTHKGLSHGIAKVLDRAIRQMAENSAFEVAWYLEYELEKHQKHNGFVAAKECEPAAAPTLAMDRAALQIDLNERRDGVQTLPLMRHGDTIWVALSDLLLFVGRKVPVSKLPRPLTARIKDRVFALRGEQPRECKALPLQLYKTFIECLPRDLAAAFRRRPSAEEASDAEWLLGKIHAKLQEAKFALPEDERLELPPRDDEVVYVTDGDRRVRVRVRVRPGKQPLLSGIDLFALIERKSRNPAVFKPLLMKTLRRFVHPQPIQFSGQSASNSVSEPTIPADCLDQMLDYAIEHLPDDKTGRRAAVGHFRDTSEYHWLREVIEDLTDSDAETTVLGHEEMNEQDESESSDSESEDTARCGEMWRLVEWKDIKPSPPCPVPLQQPHWTKEAESCIPRASSDRKNARAGDFDYHCMVAKDEKDNIVKQEIEAVLTRKSKPVSYRVGVAEILDQQNHVLKAARKNEYQGPVYLAYAKRQMRAYTILGEYTGRVVTDSMAEAEEDQRKKEMAETSSSEAAVRGEVFSKYQYNSTVGKDGKNWKQGLVLDTSHAANELSILNDYRLDVTAGTEAARRQRLRKQHLPNVTFIEVVDKAYGRPHMLFALTRDVEKGEELLIDYSDGFWEQYAANCKWMVALRHARSSGLAAGKKEAASRLLAEQAARRLAEESEAKALKKVKTLEQQLASRDTGVGSVKDCPAAAAGHVDSPPVCPLSEPSGASRTVKRKRPRKESLVGFKKGEMLTCTECDEWMKAPKATRSLTCPYCTAEIHPVAAMHENRDSDSDGDADNYHGSESDEGVETRVDAKRARRSHQYAEKVFDFRVGAVVWAKLKSHPYWPATVSKLSDNDEVDEETRAVLQKEYEKLPTSGSTAPAVVLVRWFGYDAPQWDWIDLNKLSGAQSRPTCHSPLRGLPQSLLAL
eukprot:COSAG03_NODE_46_length_16816_cov_6.510492_5_plen_1093_part_00